MGTKYIAALAACLAMVGLETRANAEAWAAPSGLHGGGLGMSPVQAVRLWTDVSFFTRAGEERTVAPGFVINRPGYTLLSPIFGFGALLTPNVELEGVLPVGAFISDNGGSGIGNPFIGVSYVLDGPELHFKAGGGIALPVLDSESDDQGRAALAGLYPRGIQTGWLWAPDALGMVFPIHIEAPLNSPVLFIGDATPYMLIPVRNRNRTDMLLELAPGVGGYVSNDVVIGVRMPAILILTGGNGVRDDDKAQVSLEPFLRIASDPVFFSARFTMPLDEPLGFAFDEGKFWGLNVGLGAGF